MKKIMSKKSSDNVVKKRAKRKQRRLKAASSDGDANSEEQPPLAHRDRVAAKSATTAVELAIYDRSSDVWSALAPSFLQANNPLHRLQWQLPHGTAVGGGSLSQQAATGVAGSAVGSPSESNSATTPSSRRRLMAASSPVTGTSSSATTADRRSLRSASSASSLSSTPPSPTAAAGAISSAPQLPTVAEMTGEGVGDAVALPVNEPGFYSVDLRLVVVDSAASSDLEQQSESASTVSSTVSLTSSMAHMWHTAPFVHVCVVVCEDTDLYKSRERAYLRSWVKQRTEQSQEWCILYLASATSSSVSKARRATSSLSRTVWTKLRSDFRADRCCRVSVGGQLDAEPSVDPAEWAPFADILRDAIQSSFATLVDRYTAELRKLEMQRSVPGWNFSNFFCVKEGLSFAFERARLLPEAMKQYIELEALFLDQSISHSFSDFCRTPDGASSDGANEMTESWLDESSRPYRDLIYKSQISLLDFRRYLHARQCKLLFEMCDFDSAAQKTAAFVQQMLPLFPEAVRQTGFREVWAINGCLEVARAIEQETEAGVGVVAGQVTSLGDLYSLARGLLDQLGRRLGFRALSGGRAASPPSPPPPLQMKEPVWCTDADEFRAVWQSTALRAVDCFDRSSRPRASARETLAIGPELLAQRKWQLVVDTLRPAVCLFRRDAWSLLHQEAVPILVECLRQLRRWSELARVVVHWLNVVILRRDSFSSSPTEPEPRGPSKQLSFLQLLQECSANLRQSQGIAAEDDQNDAGDQVDAAGTSVLTPPLRTRTFELKRLARDPLKEQLVATVDWKCSESLNGVECIEIECVPRSTGLGGTRRGSTRSHSSSSNRRRRAPRTAAEDALSSDDSGYYSEYYSDYSSDSFSSDSDTDAETETSNASGTADDDVGVRSTAVAGAASGQRVGVSGLVLKSDGIATLRPGLNDFVVWFDDDESNVSGGWSTWWSSGALAEASGSLGDVQFQVERCSIVLATSPSADDGTRALVLNQRGRPLRRNFRSVPLSPPKLHCQVEFEHSSVLIAGVPEDVTVVVSQFSPATSSVSLELETVDGDDRLRFPNQQDCVIVPAPRRARSLKINETGDRVCLTPLPVTLAATDKPAAGANGEDCMAPAEQRRLSFRFQLSSSERQVKLRGSLLLKTAELPVSAGSGKGRGVVETRVPFEHELSFADPFIVSARPVAGDVGARNIVAVTAVNAHSEPLLLTGISVCELGRVDGDEEGVFKNHASGESLRLDRQFDSGNRPVELAPGCSWDDLLVLPVEQSGHGMSFKIEVFYCFAVTPARSKRSAPPMRFQAVRHLPKEPARHVEISLAIVQPPTAINPTAVTAAECTVLPTQIAGIVGEKLEAVVRVHHHRRQRSGAIQDAATDNRFMYAFAATDQDQRFWLVTGARKYHFELKPGETRDFACQLFPLAAGRLELPLVQVFSDPGVLLEDVELEGAPAKVIDDTAMGVHVALAQKSDAERDRTLLLSESMRKQVVVHPRLMQSVETKSH